MLKTKAFYTFLKTHIRSGVHQFILVHSQFILEPVLLNVFLNDIFLMLNDLDLHNFDDDNTPSAGSC